MDPLKVYCRESSIHCIRYLVNKKIQPFEKIFWFLALLGSCFCCGILIQQITAKVQGDALVTYTSDIPVPVVDVSSPSNISIQLFTNFKFKIPFVAITFCPDFMTHNDKFDYNKIVSRLNRNEITIENVTQTE